MKKFLCGAIAAAFLFIGAGMAQAVTIEPGSDAESLQGILDRITVGGKSSVAASGEVNDALADSSYWSISASGGAVSTFVIGISSFQSSNVFGIYDMTDSARTVEIFSGGAETGEIITLSICDNGRIYFNGCSGRFAYDTGVNFAENAFGFYIDSDGTRLYSDSGLNAGGADYMAAFQGTDTDMVQIPGYKAGLWGSNEYILAWDDLSSGGDRDFNDLVIMIESVNPVNPPMVPEPSSLLLLGGGMVGLGYIGYRKIHK